MPDPFVTYVIFMMVCVWGPMLYLGWRYRNPKKPKHTMAKLEAHIDKYIQDRDFHKRRVS